MKSVPTVLRLATPLLALTVAALSAACSSDVGQAEGDVQTSEDPISFGKFPPPGPTTVDTPVGLAIAINNGVADPVSVRAGQRLYINQIDFEAALDTNQDEAVAGLDQTGDFAPLDWSGTTMVDQSFQPTANQDNGKFTRRRFYRKAKWMDTPSAFVIEQLDANGHPSGLPWIADTGLEYLRTPIDSFFDRRLRAIQWTNDCPALDDCTGATSFREEALVELRYANGPNFSQKIGPNTTKLRVRWSLKPNSPYIIPVTQVAHPDYDYGISPEITPVTAAGPNGYYAPGQMVSFQVTLKDASGKRLHPQGSLPTYQEFLNGTITSGITYWRGPLEPFATYYRRKHQEKQMDLVFQGPKQKLQPIHNIIDFNTAIDFSTGIVTVAKPSTEGFYGAIAVIPNLLFVLGGPATFGLPVTDTYSFTIPSDADAGTYSVTLKGRRTYLGEDIPYSKTIQVQVGTSTHTEATLNTGPCNSCHKDGSALGRINHGNDDRSTCTSCHAPLTFELDNGPTYVRVHFIHSRTDRLNQTPAKCDSCHLNKAGIQRTSKSACMSCHKSYPQSHVQAFGPIVDMYVGGRTESFGQCTSSCHTTHPQSGL
ncbi:hypothetical protein BH09MYX1_BH09MYX1_45440 [soil metagenome]